MKYSFRALICLPAAVVTWSGCAKYHPKPIVPAQIESDFKSRTLSDPGLRSYVEANLPKPVAWPPRALDLGALTLVAFYYQPELDVARAQAAVAAAGVKTAAARPNPALAVGPGYENLPSAPFLFRFNLDIPVETARKRGYRIKEAQRVTEASRLALAEMAWKVRARLRAALLDQLLFARELSLLEDQRNLQAEAVSLVRMRLEVGAVSRPVLDLAQFELSGTVLAIRSAEGRLAHARVALAGTLGVPLSALDGYTFAWPDLDQPPGEQLITRFGIQRAGLLNRIGVRRSLVEYAAAEAALQLEVARQYPNLNLNPGYAFDDGENKYTIVPALVLPIFNRNQGPIAQAEARREEAATRFLALQATVINQTETALGDYRAAFGELADADRTLTIQRQRANSAAASLKVGETDRLTLVTAHFQVAAAQMLRLNALRKTQQSLGQLEDAVERPLTGGLPLLPPGSRRP